MDLLRDAKEILSGIREACPDSRIVVLTMFDTLHYLKALSGPGIDAFLHKSSSSEELLATIDALSRRRGGQDAVVSMPRALLERLGGEPAGASRRGRPRCWCSRPAASPTTG